MNRYVCIHGHFYQPPRENAWLEAIEIQSSAYPYHDWNEQVTAQCYRPNTISRIMDSENRIIEIVNNYSKISFDFGPTLLSWLEMQAPDVYHAILAADKESQKNFSGHGSALAHAYNHLIMPLANHRDRYTQVLWGIRDFEHRFERKPEGIWLPETAVDLDTLDIMAGFGVKFTILAPRQAASVREIEEDSWQDVNENTIDTTMPYVLNLPSGRKLNIFFYNGAIAAAVAFQGLLRNGEDLANRLIRSLSINTERLQLAHIATDGESYGHHHRFGDMALAYALHHIEKNNLAQITNYGEFLEKQPPIYEVRILENTSWSCSHGIERWRSDCGCSDHYHPGWNQSWRVPLREALDWLRDDITPRFEDKARKLFKDPWRARDDYIGVILDRSAKNVAQFLEKHASHKLGQEDTVTALKLMELQRHVMLMYTSCGWFFDDLARIESVQIVHYAGRVAQLAQELFGNATENEFLERLVVARSNITDYGDGSQIYRRFVKPTFIDLKKVAAHFAVNSFFEQYPDKACLYCYETHVKDFKAQKCGRNSINSGRIKVTSLITTESMDMDFVALLREDNIVAAGINLSQTFKAYEKIVGEISAACSMDNLPQIELLLKTHFRDSIYTISSLFRDTQHNILDNVMDSTLMEMKRLYYPGLQSYSSVTPLVDEITSPLPQTFRPLVQLVLNLDLRHELKAEGPDMKDIRKILDDARLWHIDLNDEQHGIIFSRTIEKTMKAFVSSPEDTTLIDSLTEMVELARSLPFSTDLQRAQSMYYLLLKTIYKDFTDRRREGDPSAVDWINKFVILGERLSVKVDE
jgi:alpha-amylase/alpha-mannosidase (GH57 family)